MAFETGQSPVWPIPPDWASGVRETLTWSTEILQARATGVTQHLAGREYPLRRFSFDVIAGGAEKRLADALVASFGSMRWRLPIWPDVQYLPAVPDGSVVINCRTLGFDFHAGGVAMLWRGINDWAVVGIADVVPGAIVLSSPLDRAWPRGTRLYPLRWARMEPSSSFRVATDAQDSASMAFVVDEPSAWAEALPPDSYRGHPVMDMEPDWGEESERSYSRLTDEVTDATGAPFTVDTAGVSFRQVGQQFRLWGRDSLGRFRSLLYALRGRQRPLWVPSWSSDLKIVAPVNAGAGSIDVEWCGYSVLPQGSRRDLRIELRGGVVLYRRVVSSVEVGEIERLTLDSPINLDGPVHAVRRVSFMVLSTLASDETQLFHDADADGLTRVSIAWKEVVTDV